MKRLPSVTKIIKPRQQYQCFALEDTNTSYIQFHETSQKVYLPENKTILTQGQTHNLPKGADHGEHGARCDNRGQGPSPLPLGSRGKSPKAFNHYHTKEGPKVKELSVSLSPCLRPTASDIHDQPQLVGNGSGCPYLDLPVYLHKEQTIHYISFYICTNIFNY